MPYPNRYSDVYISCDLPNSDKLTKLTGIGVWSYHGAQALCISTGWGSSSNKTEATVRFTSEKALECGCHTFKKLTKMADDERKHCITESIAHSTRGRLEDGREYGSTVLLAAMNKGYLLTYRCGLGGFIILTESGDIKSDSAEFGLMVPKEKHLRIQSMLGWNTNSKYIESKIYPLSDIKSIIVANTVTFFDLLCRMYDLERIKELMKNASQEALDKFINDYKFFHPNEPSAIGVLVKNIKTEN